MRWIFAVSIRQARQFGAALLMLTAAALSLGSCGRRVVESAAAGGQVVVLGIDGMDPGFLERHWDALPNLRRLRRQGGFRRLQTVTPPQSPVAWSAFITGAGPGSTGIYDFIHRRPESMALYSSMTQTHEGGRTLRLGPYRFPVSRGAVRSLRRGTPFWQTLADRGVPVAILRMPTNFPPVEAGLAISGMGTPDLLGTYGTFTLYTDNPREKTRAVPGGAIVRVNLDRDSSVRLNIAGPANTLRADQAPTGVTMRAHIDSGTPVARFDLNGQAFILRQGEWSDWIHTRFPLLPPLFSVAGMFRLYAKQLHPRFEAYLSPINIDPVDPALPIAFPGSYSRELARAVGSFHTQGMPHATAAWRQGVFDRAEYLDQSRQTSQEMLRLLRYAVEHYRDGLLFFHFFGVDQNSHMLWGRYDDDLLDTYRLVDDAIGWVHRKLPHATLLVISDHGFSSFERAVNLNAWLRQESFLVLQEGAVSGGQDFEKVDWSRTRAYAAGLNAIYVNQEGRERHGIVSAGRQTAELAREIRGRLLALRDPENGAPVAHSVALPASDFHGAALDLAPDLVVGYYPGYRASWETALGATPETLIDDNTDPWRGDHCIDPAFVPGVVLANRRIRAESPRLTDITATVLRAFGVEPTPEITGESIF